MLRMKNTPENRLYRLIIVFKEKIEEMQGNIDEKRRKSVQKNT